MESPTKIPVKIRLDQREDPMLGEVAPGEEEDMMARFLDGMEFPMPSVTRSQIAAARQQSNNEPFNKHTIQQARRRHAIHPTTQKHPINNRGPQQQKTTNNTPPPPPPPATPAEQNMVCPWMPAIPRNMRCVSSVPCERMYSSMGDLSYLVIW